jgi:surface protein
MDIGVWDVSHLIDMTGMFYDARAFNQDISNWDVSRITDIGGTFADACDFDQDISYRYWGLFRRAGYV